MLHLIRLMTVQGDALIEGCGRARSLRMVRRGNGSRNCNGHARTRFACSIVEENMVAVLPVDNIQNERIVTNPLVS